MLAEPKRVNMNEWGAIMDPEEYDNYKQEGDAYSPNVTRQRPPCGAVGCMAGNLCIMEGEIVPSEHFDGSYIYELGCNTPTAAANILRISENEAAKLFYLKSWGRDIGWSKEFSDRLEDCIPGTKEYVQVIVDRNEHYIATGE
jgi:hypothetical protein